MANNLAKNQRNKKMVEKLWREQEYAAGGGAGGGAGTGTKT